ncbi:uncharacterized protein LOC110445104 [Mizuhopecten yessoensis]|uniref:uncharacterized protein LOC110445104 n=1 Tax=Mizuhopecten yessoensis TaxID=6573 RepID=UPI000B45713F|nr:uncharacterized protein LOC110445104 [Mizuhopecten yessoensis]
MKRLLGYTDSRPLHVSRVLAINETIHIPCYYCGGPEILNLLPKLGHYREWFKLARNQSDAYWRLRPVVGDKKFGSRANIISNFTLIIRNIQERDTGMYYCAVSKIKHSEYRFNDKQLKTFLTEKDPNRFKLYLHIDGKCDSPTTFCLSVHDQFV